MAPQKTGGAFKSPAQLPGKSLMFLEAVWYNYRMSPNSEFDLLEPKPLTIVISGPSGAGKDAVVRLMKQRGLPFHFVVTATTRPKRDEEVEGKDYFFVSKDEFARMIQNDELLEYAVVYGDYKGIPRKQVSEANKTGKDLVMRLDVQGAETVKKELGDVTMIFITTRSGEELERRLRKRESETPEELALRIATARQELKRVDQFDYVVYNFDDRLDEAADTIQSIIEAEHHKVQKHRAEP